MGEVIKFPDQGDKSKNKVSETNLSTHDSLVASLGKNFSIKNNPEVQAFLSDTHPFVHTGNEVIVEVFGKKYKATVTSILEKDSNNNVTKIAYVIPYLGGDDPVKFGEANFTYTIEIHD